MRMRNYHSGEDAVLGTCGMSFDARPGPVQEGPLPLAPGAPSPFCPALRALTGDDIFVGP